MNRTPLQPPRATRNALRLDALIVVGLVILGLFLAVAVVFTALIGGFRR